MKREPMMNRRTLLGVAGAGALGVLAAPHVGGADKPATKGRIKQSVCRWCYNKIDLDKLAEEAKKIGHQSIVIRCNRWRRASVSATCESARARKPGGPGEV